MPQYRAQSANSTIRHLHPCRVCSLRHRLRARICAALKRAVKFARERCTRRQFSARFPERQKRSESFLHVLRSVGNVRKVFWVFSGASETFRKFPACFPQRRNVPKAFCLFSRASKTLGKFSGCFPERRKHSESFLRVF